MAVEIVEFQGLNSPPSRSRFFDPGAITLTLGVQDLEAMKTRLARIKGLEWISANMGRVMVRDPDGIFVELQQVRKEPSPIGVAPDAPKVRLGVTVEDVGRTARFYRDALGFTGGSATATGLALQVPGDAFPFDVKAPNYADRTPLHPEIHAREVGRNVVAGHDHLGSERLVVAVAGPIEVGLEYDGRVARDGCFITC